MKHLLSFLFFSVISATIMNFQKTVKIKDLKLKKCSDNQDYPVLVSNLTIQLINTKIIASGSIFIERNLKSPIIGDVDIKRNVWGVWIPIPCKKNVGSCYYEDLCKFGVKSKQDCPKNLKDNDVPCRCPITKGNYTIPPAALLDLQDENSILEGNYKGQITVNESKQQVSCYNIFFQLYETVEITAFNTI